MLMYVMRPFAAPSPVGYANSHASSYISGTAAFTNMVPPIIVLHRRARWEKQEEHAY